LAHPVQRGNFMVLLKCCNIFEANICACFAQNVHLKAHITSL